MTWMPGPSRGRRPELLVLVVDNDAETRSALIALVGSFGVEAQGVADGEEAYRLAVVRPPDLILCGLEMPALDGGTLIRRLRRNPRFRRILAVALSESKRPVDVTLTREAGFDGHIAKPVRSEVLARLLDRAVDHQNARDEPQGA